MSEALHCLLLAPPRQAVPDDLLRSLGRRRIHARVLPDAPAVLADLDHAHADILLLVDPPSLPDADAFLHAALERHPTLRLWQYQPPTHNHPAQLTHLLAPSSPIPNPQPLTPNPDLPLLTPQELQMLLGDPFDEQTPPTPPSRGASPGSPASSQEPSSTPHAAPEPLPRGEGPGTPLPTTNLLETLLRNRQQLPDHALSVLRRQTRLESLALVPADAQIPPDHHAAEVAFDGHLFGCLHAPAQDIDPHDLAGHAQWLARWLAVEKQVSWLWHMALRDALTGAWNRGYFDRFLQRVLQRAADERFAVTVLVFDLDDFKRFNDRYGHAAGDDILRETARLMQSVVRTQDVVARIGGDEFAVIFWDAEAPRKPNSRHPQDVRIAADRFRKALASHQFPKLTDEAPGCLTISGGLASFPWDGRSPQELLERADAMALQSKRQGKNVITFGPNA
ncbi:MAG: diguanylate cyclase [Phycisphaeraceae bacterium]|nr:diguanylate cyclase [Phycisphaeraceae bacterium]